MGRDQAYSDTKLHDVLLAFAVARRWPDILSNALEPGWVPTKMGGAGAPDDLDQGHRTQVWLAVSEDPAAKVTGQYFYHLKRRAVHPAAHDAKIQDKLLAACKEMSGVDFSLMPLTKLDKIAALVVIDLQKGITGMPTVNPAAEIIGRTAQLARAFRERELPVVLVNVAGGAPGRTDAGPPKFVRAADWAELLPSWISSPAIIWLRRRPGEHFGDGTSMLICASRKSRRLCSLELRPASVWNPPRAAHTIWDTT